MKKKVALITGGAQGIGREIACHLSKDGYDIAIVDLKSQAEGAEETVKLVKENGQEAKFFPTDVTDQQQVFTAVDQTVAHFGTLTTMVNNAGIAKVDEVVSVAEADLEMSFKVNVFGVLYGIQAAGKKFKELGIPGKIINTSSIAGMKAFPIWSVYSATKAAVISFTQSAALELAPDNITVNNYAPGVVGTTDMWEEIDAKMSQINGKPIGQNKADFISQIPLGRTVRPEDVAKVVSFLASSKADYITGQTIVVDGGMS